MFVQYNNLDIRIDLDGIGFRILNIAQETLHRIIPSHSHGSQSYEIHYILQGQGKVVINGILYPAETGTLYVAGPHITHAQIPKTADPMVDFCIYLQLDDSSGNPTHSLGKLFSCRSFWIGSDTQQLEPFLLQLLKELRQRRLGYTVIVESLLQQIMIRILRNYDIPPTIPYHRFSEAPLSDARAFIIEEAFLYEYATLTLEQLARKLGLCERQTQRMLLHYYGKTFREKRNEARMSAAAVLLGYTRRSISSIAEELGYATAEHFTSAFKREFNLSPKEYRKNREQTTEPFRDLALEPPEGLKSANINR